MFTGIVREIGTVLELKPGPRSRSITLRGNEAIEGMRVGDSISIDGACLTAISVTPAEIVVEAVEETLLRTTLGELRVGDSVNLERPLRVNGRLEGHIVTGHIDGTGTVVSIRPEGVARRMRIEADPELLSEVVEKGSIAVDGVSLTVTAVDPSGFEVVLVPHTLATTGLGTKSIGTTVNLETDILAKYLRRLVTA